MSRPYTFVDVLSLRAFVRYMIGTSFSMTGTGIRFVAFTWLALQLTNAGYSVALVLLCETIPGILFSPLIGVYVDRHDRRMIVTLITLFQALVLVTIPVLAWLGHLQPWQLYAVTFCIATGDVIYRAGSMALIREIVPHDMLLVGNTTNAIGNQIGLAIGALIAGLTIAWASISAAVVVYVACLLISAWGFWTVRRSYVAPQERVVKTQGWNQVLVDLRSGISYIRDHTEIIPSYTMMLMLVSTLRTINVLLPPFSKDVLQVGGEGFGYIDSMFAIGAILGNIAIPQLRHRYGESWVMSSGVLGLVASLWIFATATNLWSAIVGYFLIGVTYQVFTLFLTQSQQRVAVAYQGRVHTTFSLIINMISVAIYGMMSWLGTLVSLRWLYVLQGLVLLAVALLVRRQVWSRRAAQLVGEDGG